MNRIRARACAHDGHPEGIRSGVSATVPCRGRRARLEGDRTYAEVVTALATGESPAAPSHLKTNLTG